MYGDLQGIAGKTLREVDGLEISEETMPLLPERNANTKED
jgi:hypothetical protein